MYKRGKERFKSLYTIFYLINGLYYVKSLMKLKKGKYMMYGSERY